MSFDLRLDGLRAVVTGGTMGLGAAVVKALNDAGARVATSARSTPSQPFDGVTYVAADLSTAEGAHHFAQTIHQEWGGADILVNVLGGSKTPVGGFGAISDEHWFAELNLNLMPAVRLDRALLPAMLAQGSGVVIHVSSIQRVLPLHESTTAYSAAKGALTTYSKSLAREVTPKGVRVARAMCVWRCMGLKAWSIARVSVRRSCAGSSPICPATARARRAVSSARNSLRLTVSSRPSFSAPSTSGGISAMRNAPLRARRCSTDMAAGDAPIRPRWRPAAP